MEMKKKIVVLMIILLGGLSNLGIAKTNSKIKGVVIDAESNEPLEFANVVAFPAGYASQAGGTAANEKGEFVLEGLPFAQYDIKIFMMGYETYEIKNVTVNAIRNLVDLKKIKLKSKVLSFSAVEAVAERSQLQLELDKKVFIVGKDLANTGSSATDVLDDIPSVTVDVEGNVSLRGSENVRILVDGKPSGLVGLGTSNALKQLSANLIERVEVVTNPSARYDAEGTAGIINIVLRKDRREGLNGSVDVMAGNPKSYGAALNLNYRRDNLNFFMNYGFRSRNFPGHAEQYQEFYNSDTTTYLEEEQERERGGWSNNVRLGTDYFINDKNILTAAFLYDYGDEENKSTIVYRDFDWNYDLVSSSNRKDLEGEIEKAMEFELTYKKLFTRKDHELVVNLKYQADSEHETNDITERSHSALDLVQYVSNLEEETDVLFQVDYVHPFNKHGKFEAGWKSNLRDVNNDYYVEEQDAAGAWFFLPNLSNNLDYSENIHAGYAIIGTRISRFSYQFGLRGEYSDIGTFLHGTGERNDRSYFDLFPSTHFTYDVLEHHSLQLSYSRRLRRPRHRALNPFSGYTDNRNIRRGNPNLNPEFTNSYEVGHISHWENASVSSSLYYRHTDDEIEQISFLEDSVMVRQPENLATEDSYGLEITGSVEPFKWWSTDGNLNFYQRKTQGDARNNYYTSESFSWFARLTSKVTVWNDWNLQFRYHYRAPRETVQGKRKAAQFLDLAMSKDVFDGNGTVTFSMRDVFNSRKFRNETFGDGFYSRSEFQRRSRVFMIGFSYRINQNKRPGGGDESNGNGGEFNDDMIE